MKLLFVLLIAPFLASAQSPSPHPSPVPPIGYIAGIEKSGTSIWTKPVRRVPVFYGNPTKSPVFISGTTIPTLAAVQLVLAQRAATQALSVACATALAAGVTVTSGSLSLTLAAEPSDRQAFDELLTLLNTAQMPPNLMITDVHGTSQTVTVAQYYALIGSYGQQVAGLWKSLATAKASVAVATGTAALSKITITNPTGQ